jgi:hypothetical protein
MNGLDMYISKELADKYKRNEIAPHVHSGYTLDDYEKAFAVPYPANPSQDKRP